MSWWLTCACGTTFGLLAFALIALGIVAWIELSKEDPRWWKRR
jgi:hypothetical protein